MVQINFKLGNAFNLLIKYYISDLIWLFWPFTNFLTCIFSVNKERLDSWGSGREEGFLVGLWSGRTVPGKVWVSAARRGYSGWPKRWHPGAPAINSRWLMASAARRNFDLKSFLFFSFFFPPLFGWGHSWRTHNQSPVPTNACVNSISHLRVIQNGHNFDHIPYLQTLFPRTPLEWTSTVLAWLKSEPCYRLSR